MNSIGHRAVTVVTIVTLIYAPFFKSHHWVWKLVRKQTQTTTVTCVPNKPCPRKRTVVRKLYKQPSRADLRKAHAAGVGAPRPPRTESSSRGTLSARQSRRR